MKPCALVTGGTGFIGRYLVKELIANGWDVICLTRSIVKPSHRSVTCITADLATLQACHLAPQIVRKVDVIFHLAALLPNSAADVTTERYIHTNVLGTVALLELFRSQFRSAVFVYMSSLPVIGKPKEIPITEEHVTKPETPYLISKLTSELLCAHAHQSENLRSISLRVTSPYGAGMTEQTVLPIFVKSAMTSKDITLHGTGQRTQNFVHVSDVVRACLLAATAGANGIFNVAGETSISMRDLAAMVIKASPNCSSNIIFGETPDPQEGYRWDVSLSLSNKLLGYVPATSLATGISDYINFLSSGERPYRWWQEA